MFTSARIVFLNHNLQPQSPSDNKVSSNTLYELLIYYRVHQKLNFNHTPSTTNISFFKMTSFSLFLLLFIISAHSVQSASDPNCSTGFRKFNACCPKACGSCNGPQCGIRGDRIGLDCCPLRIQNNQPSCNQKMPPCKITTQNLPVVKPTQRNPVNPTITTKGYWRFSQVWSGKVIKRHEACAVMVNGLVVLVGGRGANKPVSIYNPKTRAWVTRQGPGNGIQIHHFQCVAAQGKVWIISSWGGRFPYETNNDRIYIYDVAANKWSTRAGLPPWRRRGGAAAVLRGDQIYLVGGNRGGHGGHATSYGWFDCYNYKTNKWSIGLPTMPDPRDHVGGGMVNGQLCVVGGRDGGSASFFNAARLSVWCFNFGQWKWNRRQNIPVGRAGAMTGSTCDGKLMIAGGEGNGGAYKRVDVFNGWTWQKAPFIVRQRHGSGLAIANCACGHIFIPSGSGSQGGSPELLSTEQYIPAGASEECGTY